MEFEGKIIFIGDVENITTKNGEAQKITFVVEEESDNEFKKSIACEQFGEKKVETAKSLKVGDYVKVQLDIRAREYNGRWYNSVSAWRVEGTSSSSNNIDDLPF